MKNLLQNHPFAVEAFFKSSLILTFAAPIKQLQAILPICLTVDGFKERWGFVAVAIVQTKNLRPKGFHKALGKNFFLIGYRIFVRYNNTDGKNLRGLFILKSETNKKEMELLGNIFTKYSYSTTDIVTENNDDGLYRVKSIQSDLDIVVNTKEAEVQLPHSSPFKDWKEARRFAGPLPYTFSYDDVTKEVLIIEGVRQNWTPHPVKVINHHIGYLTGHEFGNLSLANAFLIENIPYYWKKGKIEQWQS